MFLQSLVFLQIRGGSVISRLKFFCGYAIDSEVYFKCKVSHEIFTVEMYLSLWFGSCVLFYFTVEMYLSLWFGSCVLFYFTVEMYLSLGGDDHSNIFFTFDVSLCFF